MKKALFAVFMAVLLFTGCAAVPKESVELSATVGRDITELHKSHRQTIVLMYQGMKERINSFVDDVYAPYQIQKTVAQYKDLFAQAFREAEQPDPTGAAQKQLIEVLDIYITELRKEVEDYRASMLGPVIAQENELLRKIDESYMNVHYANSIVTGYLSSVAKVKEAQQEVLDQAGLDVSVDDIAKKLAKLSELIDTQNKAAQKNLDKAEEAANKVKEFIDKM